MLVNSFGREFELQPAADVPRETTAGSGYGILHRGRCHERLPRK